MNTHFLYEVFQLLTVSTLVAGCAVYCLLTLAPQKLQQALKQVLLRFPVPVFVATKLRQTASACGSGCSGCSSGAATPQTVKWHPRKR